MTTARTEPGIAPDVAAVGIVSSGGFGKRRFAVNYAAADGKHYWNCWTRNYQPDRDGYCIHVFCEEEKTGRTLCGVIPNEGGGQACPLEEIPSCVRCRKIMVKRGALSLPNVADEPRA